MTFLDALNADDRDQADARAATAESERDDALTDLRAARADRDQWEEAAGQLTKQLDEMRDARDVLRYRLGQLTAENARLRQIRDAQEAQLTANATLIAQLRNLDEQRDRAYAAHDDAADFRALAEPAPVTGPANEEVCDICARQPGQVDCGCGCGKKLCTPCDTTYRPIGETAMAEAQQLLATARHATAAAPVPVAPAQEPTADGCEHGVSLDEECRQCLVDTYGPDAVPGEQAEG